MSVTQTDYPALFARYVENGVASLAATLARSMPPSRPVSSEERPTQEPVQSLKLSAQTRERAFALLDFALAVPHLWARTCTIVTMLATLSEQDGHWAECVPLLQRAIHQCEGMEDRHHHALFQLHLGVFYRLLAQYAQARTTLMAAYEEFAALQDRPRLAYTTFRRAQLERMASNVQEAERLAMESLTLFAEDDPQRGGCFMVLGAVACDRFEWQQAEDFFRLALQERLRGEDGRALAWAYADLGTALQGQKRYAEAIESYAAAMQLMESLHAAAEKAVFQLNLAAIYLTMEDARPALELCLAAMPIFRQNRDVRRTMMAATNLGIAHRYLQEWEQGEAAFEEAIEIARRWGFQQPFVNALDQLGLLYLDVGRLEEAVASFDAALPHLDQIPVEAARERFRVVLSSHRAQAEQRSLRPPALTNAMR